jgi:outer membrane receptor protein involved in Fe transport
VGNAERATWHQAGPYLENEAPKNSLFQAEAGYKRKFSNGGVFATAFYANTQEEAGVEVTTQNVLSNDYQSYGLELESFFRIKGFDIRGALTYVRAEIVDNNDNVNIGNTPRRQPGLTYNILPSYNFKKGHVVGVSVIGQTQSYAQDNNELVMPGYAIVNAFVSYRITEKLSLNLNANNLLNALGFTEAEEGSIVDNQTNFIRARSIAGRSVMGGLILNF